MVTFQLSPEYFLDNLRTNYEITNIETPFLKVSVFPIFYKHNVIEWEIPGEWGSCKFDVYRSDVEKGPWKKITVEPVSSYFIKDREVPEVTKFMSMYYLVECILPDNRRVKSEVTTWENKQSSFALLRAKEIQRRESILLSKFVGVDTIFFRRKRFGKKCPVCWDSTSEDLIMDKCPSCFGTGFEGGYWGGYNTLLQYDPTPSSAEFSYQGLVERNVITAWTIANPKIESLDIIYRVPDRKLYRVGQKQTTELQAVEIRQMLQLVEIGTTKAEQELVKRLLPDEYVNT